MALDKLQGSGMQSSPQLSKGYIPYRNDYSLFNKLVGYSLTIVVIYVDDILLTGMIMLKFLP